MSVVSKASQAALTKLLIKLNLLPKECNAEFRDYSPIAHFAQAGQLDEAMAIKLVAEHLGISEINPDKDCAKQTAELLASSPLSNISLDRWRNARALPIALKADKLIVAFANPLDHEAKLAFEFDLGLSLELAICCERKIISTLNATLKSTSNLELDDSSQTKENSNVEPTSSQAFESNVFSGDLSAAPVVRLCNQLLSDSVETGASDIHVEPERDRAIVRVRVDGMMRNLMTVPGAMQSAVISRLKLLAGMDITEKRRPQDGRLRVNTAAGAKDLRLSTVPTVFGENLVIRILSTEIARVSFKSSGMPPQIEERFERSLRGSSRVVLVTGPTGSGKTSTLYAGLSTLHDGSSTIVTIEDPIEYRISGISQIQVHNKIGMGFAEGLRSVLRQDPDIIMVGEIRDLETAEIAMKAAQTGHLVLSTLHANTAPASITRLKDLGVAPYLIASSVSTILAQRLIRTVCRKCLQPSSGDVHKRIEKLGIDTTLTVQAAGCDECGGSGYKGRTGIFSMLEINAGLRNLIREDAGEDAIAQAAHVSGYRSLFEAGLELVMSGQTTLAELERIIGPAEDHGYALKQKEKPKSGMQKPRVLLIEDDSDVRWTLATLLRTNLYEVDEAENGRSALECVFENPPQLVICDLMMPIMNGLDFVRRIKNDPRTRNIPVLMLTAANSEENEVELLSSGADDFLGKVSSPRVMLTRIEKLLAKAF